MADTTSSTTDVPYGFADRFDYRVDILPRRNRVTASLDGVPLADTTASLVVDEQDHGLVLYIPRVDVRMDLLVATDDSSICPYKGVASYWKLADGAEGDGPIAWAYDSPWPEVARIAGHIAFYQDIVQVSIGQAPYNGPR
jgi:uncharacterized protein (DUF427 family)